jgi:hypothetical protein
MPGTSIVGSSVVALAGSPVQRLLLACDPSGGSPPTDERMLQELCALAGSHGRRRRQRRRQWRASRHGAPRLSAQFRIELEMRAPGARPSPGPAPASPGA